MLGYKSADKGNCHKEKAFFDKKKSPCNIAIQDLKEDGKYFQETGNNTCFPTPKHLWHQPSHMAEARGRKQGRASSSALPKAEKKGEKEASHRAKGLKSPFVAPSWNVSYHILSLQISSRHSTFIICTGCDIGGSEVQLPFSPAYNIFCLFLLVLEKKPKEKER